MSIVVSNILAGIGGWPKCARCGGKRVDKVEAIPSFNMDARTVRVHCHGETEEQLLTALMVHDSHGIAFGYAFEKPLLENKSE